MRPSRIWIPNAMTAGSLAAGFGATLLAMEPKYFGMAIALIFLSSFLDTMDGRVARFLKASSEFGMELDSLADLVAFGVAPAMLMYQFSLHDLGWWGAVPAVIFVVCGGLRLARFNVLTRRKEVPCTVFIGCPIPPAAIMVTALVLVELVHKVTLDVSFHWLLMLGLGLLMVSNLPFPSFKRGMHGPKNPVVTVVLLSIVAILFIRQPDQILLIGVSSYIAFGLFNSTVQAFFDLQEWLWSFSSLPRIETTIDAGFTWK